MSNVMKVYLLFRSHRLLRTVGGVLRPDCTLLVAKPDQLAFDALLELPAKLLFAFMAVGATQGQGQRQRRWVVVLIQHLDVTTVVVIVIIVVIVDVTALKNLRSS